MSNEIEIEALERRHTHSDLTSNDQEEMKIKVPIKKSIESLSHRNKDSNDFKKKEIIISTQESNNYSVKTGQPLCLKSLDKQEGLSHINFIPSLNEMKRGETNSDFNTNRIFIFNQEDDKTEKALHSNLLISTFLKKVTKQQFISFLLSPIQKKIWLRCKIKKERINGSVFFNCYLNDYDDDLLMVISMVNAKKYMVYTNLNFISPNMIPIAKIKKNFMGTKFSLTPTIIEEYQTPKIYINYSINVLGLAGPMGMKVKIPLDNEEEPFRLRNKSPMYSERYKCYVLDYIDRKDVQCSTKNFQLVSMKDMRPTKTETDELDSEERNKIILQFGVIDCNCYLLDFKYPLSPIQAFAIAISNLHNKLMCE